MKSKRHITNCKYILSGLTIIVVAILFISIIFLYKCICNANTLQPNFEQLKTEYQNQQTKNTKKTANEKKTI